MEYNKSLLFFLSLFILLTSFEELKLKKKITDKEFRYEFFVTEKKAETKENRMYYWFKGGEIHNSESGISGHLLNDSFEKFYLNNQLAEKGMFNKGLKVGYWKTWHPNGVIKSTQYWDTGRKNGAYHLYDQKGELIEKGYYRRNKKQGKWINYLAKDTVTYKNNEILVVKLSDEQILRNKEKKEKQTAKKEKREALEKEKKLKKQGQKQQEQQKKLNKKRQNEVKGKNSDKEKPSKEKKENFFTRLFSKKKTE